MEISENRGPPRAGRRETTRPVAVEGRGAVISEQERERRRVVIEGARHSSEMEGGGTTPAARAVQDAWVRGELTLEEFIDRVSRNVTADGRPRPSRGG